QQDRDQAKYSSRDEQRHGSVFPAYPAAARTVLPPADAAPSTSPLSQRERARACPELAEGVRAGPASIASRGNAAPTGTPLPAAPFFRTQWASIFVQSSRRLPSSWVKTRPSTYGLTATMKAWKYIGATGTSRTRITSACSYNCFRAAGSVSPSARAIN